MCLAGQLLLTTADVFVKSWGLAGLHEVGQAFTLRWSIMNQWLQSSFSSSSATAVSDTSCIRDGIECCIQLFSQVKLLRTFSNVLYCQRLLLTGPLEQPVGWLALILQSKQMY